MRVDDDGHEQESAHRDVGVVGHVERVLVAVPRRGRSGDQVHRREVAEHRDLHVEHRDVDLLPHAGPVAGDDRRQDAQRARHAAAEVAVQRTRPHGRAVGVAGHAHHARVGLDAGVERRPVSPRACEPVAGNRAGDDPRVHVAQGGVVDAEPFGHPGPVVVYNHVGPADEVVEGAAARLIAQVDDDAPLVARQRQQVGREALERVARVRALEDASRVPRWLLHLDDVRAEVGEKRRSVGP